MKRLLALLLSLCLSLSLCACGGSGSGSGSSSAKSPATSSASGSGSASGTASSPDGSSSDSSVSSSASSDNSADSSNGDSINVDKGPRNVTLTLPASYVDEGTTQESLDEECEGSGWESATLNEDGSVTCVMTLAQHEELMDSIVDEIQTALDEMVGSEDYPSITAIDHDDNFTEFTVSMDADELSMTDSIASLGLMIYGGMYHVFNGTSDQAENIHIQYINADTGEVLDETSAADMADSLNALQDAADASSSSAS